MPGETKPLRVLLVAARSFPYAGGVETHLNEVAPRLARSGVQATILSTDPSGHLPKMEQLDGVHIRRVRAWPAHRDYYFAPEVYRIVAQGPWDLVHCQGYHTFVAPLALLAARRARIPYVVTFHSGGDNSRVRRALRRGQRFFLRPLLAGARGLICPSEWEAQYFSERLRLPRTRFVVIPNGANHLAPEASAADAEPSAGKLIVSLGRLERYKGHQRVINALPAVLHHYPDVRLRIVGTGPYEPALRRLVSNLHLNERVEIAAVPLGDQASLPSLLARADLIALLSEHEAQGIAVLEALSLKRPVLVAATSALQEFVDRGFARSVPIRSSPAQIAAAIVRQLRDPLLPGDCTLPQWDACAASLLDLYRSIDQRRPCAS